MITIFAEKPDVGTKIAAALDAITLENGKRVSFEELGAYEKQIKALRAKQGYLKIRYQNQETYVTWGYGHICTLKQAQDFDPSYKQWKNLPLPYIPPAYDLKLMDGVEKQYSVIKRCFEASSLIICATDNDREGDLIFDYIYRYMKCRVPFQRAIFNKQAKEEYQKAFSKEQLVGSASRMPVIEAGRARSACDFIVGAGPTVAMTLKNPQVGEVLSVGRVQTATLQILVKRELEIRNFKPKDYYVVKGLFETDQKEPYIGIHTSKAFEKKEEAEALIRKIQATDKKGIITSLKKKEFLKEKPHLYNLDTLQMDANKIYGFSLKETLDLAQSLYEQGYLTYPRTDAVHLTNDMAPEMTKVLKVLFQNPAYAKFATTKMPDASDKFYFDSSKVESHYAIVPTTKPAAGLTGDAQKIYHLVSLVTICMVYPKAVLSRTEFLTDVHGEAFTTSGTSIVEPGFYKVLGSPKEKILPAVQEKDLVSGKFAIDAKQTEPPKRYTSATLLNAMINCGRTLEDAELKKLMANGPGGKPRGLGRPSSRASIVSTLEKRKYMQTKGKTIYPTELGMRMIEMFPVEDLKSAEMTAQWEKRLDDIEKGTDTYHDFMRDMEKAVRKWTLQILNTDLHIGSNEDKAKLRCPICQREMVEYDWGYGCSGYKAGICEFSFPKTILGKTISVTQIEKFFDKGQTDVIKGFQGKDGKSFQAVLVLDKEEKRVKFALPPADNTFKCPLCGKPLRATSFGYGCSGYSEGCNFTIGAVAGKTLSRTQIKSLLEGKTIQVKGMKNKEGHRFQAGVRLNGEWRTEFVFEDRKKGSL